MQRFLYISRLAPGAQADVVPAILAISRHRNPQLGIVGVLLFDGEYFAQLLEGDAAVVAPLAERIQRDDRHVDFTVLADEQGAPPHGQRWLAGWAPIDSLCLLGQADDAFAAFDALLASCDLQ